MCNGWDDEQLLIRSERSDKGTPGGPFLVRRDGNNADAWHNIDAELAQLTYDSNDVDKREAAVVRSETASVEFLTFTSADLTMELKVAGSSLLGQVLPPRSGTLQNHTRAGAIIMAEVDEIGRFTLDPSPDSPFRLRGRMADGADLLTGWITLSGVVTGLGALSNNGTASGDKGRGCWVTATGRSDVDRAPWREDGRLAACLDVRGSTARSTCSWRSSRRPACTSTGSVPAS